MSIEKPKEVIDLIKRSLLAKKLGMNEEAIALIKLAINKNLKWWNEAMNIIQLMQPTGKALSNFIELQDCFYETLGDLDSLRRSFIQGSSEWIAIAEKYQGEKIND